MARGDAAYHRRRNSTEIIGALIRRTNPSMLESATKATIVLQKNGSGGWNILTVKLSDTPFSNMDQYSQATTSIPFEEYPALNGLGGWLNPESHPFSSDEENIKEYVSRLPEESADALVQGKAYLKLQPFPWK